MKVDPQFKKILGFNEVSQVGIVVRDMEKSMKNYSEIFGIVFYKVNIPEYFNTTYRGKPGFFRLKIAVGKVGDLDIELIQVLEGETVHGEFLEKRGEGLHHLGIRVKNMDEQIEALGKLGVGVIQSGQRVGSKWVYMDTEKIIGIILELIERK